MTTGSKAIGSFTTSTYAFQRTWTGADGRYIVPSGPFTADNLQYNNYTTSVQETTKTAGPTGLVPFRVTWPSDPWTSLDTVRLQAGIVQQVKGHNFNLGVAVAEGRQTVSLVRSNLSKIGLALRDLKHGNFERAARRLGVPKHRIGVFKDIKQGKRTIKGRFYRYSPDFRDKILRETFPPNQLNLRDISAQWLELQYGWKPLLSDVFESAKALEVLTNKPRTVRFYASHIHRPTVDFSSSDTNMDFYGHVDSIRTLLYIMKESLSTPRSLGLLDPATVLWEVVPYSFVIDWFIPIGTYLENLNTIPKLSGTFISSQKLYREQKAKNRAGKSGFQAAFWAGASIKKETDFSYTRTVSSAVPVAKPSFKPLDSVMSPLHIWNAIALAHQRVKII